MARKTSAKVEEGGSNLKSERFMVEERRLLDAAEKGINNMKALSKSLSQDKLIVMVKESSNIREKNLEALIKGGEEQSEIYLAKHIRE
jgi:hypothetical protein